MGRRLRRIAALALALLLTAQMAPGTLGAPAGDVYLVAVNIDVLEVKQESMPFWSGGHLYVSNEIFAGANRTALGVACSRPLNKPVVLYSLSSVGTALFFDLETGQSYDGQNNAYHLPAIQRGSYVFFPIDLVASVLGLTYSYTPASPAPLIRIKNPRVSQLPDEYFLDAAAGRIQQRYNDYIRSLDDSQSTTAPTAPVYTGQRVYLILTLGDSARGAADILDRQGAQALFLVTPDQIPENEDLIRSLSATGQGIGLLLPGQGALEEAERGNRLLWQTARLRTRLVRLEDGGEEERQALREAGYCPVDSRLDLSGRPLTSSRRAESAYSQITGLSGRDQTVFLGASQDSLTGLSSLLSRLKEAQCRILAYRETL